MARRAGAIGLFIAATWSSTASAEVPVQTTLHLLPASNGHGAILLDLKSARLSHFREHLFASEEPLIDAGGNELWDGNQPLAVTTRDLLFDAYFGLRLAGDQSWLTGDPVDLAKSGYVEYLEGTRGGTGIVRMVQTRGGFRLNQYFFCPQSLGHAGFVMLLALENASGTAQAASLFSLHNFHLGFGRPGARQEIGDNGETASLDQGYLSERGFAGVVVAKPLASDVRFAASFAAAGADQNLFAIVDSGNGDFPAMNGGDAPVHDATVTGLQWDLGPIAAGEKKWVGVAFAHHGDPFAAATVQTWLSDYLKNRGAEQLLADETSGWALGQNDLIVPANLSVQDEALYRHSAVMLSMAQVKEASVFLREWLSRDGEARHTRFGDQLGDPPAALPATVAHRGHGAILASLPPGEWTVSWVRDASYSIAALASMGLHERAKDALAFYLDAESGRFQGFSELGPEGIAPYRISLVRYHGFGVEETDFNDFGPNLEFDGFGLFLWALGRYYQATSDATFVTERWQTVRDEIAEVIVGLIEPDTGLMRRDSSIWETHWNGRQRHWAYTNITAARGLCDAAELAAIAGDEKSAAKYRAAGEALRRAIAEKLSDKDGAIASNTEELASGAGYWDAAVLEAIALELFDPAGRIANNTFAGIEQKLTVPAGAGWARNDDRFDHQGGNDLSPWGSEYDSGEWVFTDMRGAVAATKMGNDARALRLTTWVRDQALANYLEIAEVFDEGKGTYKFNSPMVGFGAGAYALALQARDAARDPACGAYFDEGEGRDGPAGEDAGLGFGAPDPSCGCSFARKSSRSRHCSLLLLAMVLLRRKRSRGFGCPPPRAAAQQVRARADGAAARPAAQR